MRDVRLVSPVQEAVPGSVSAGPGLPSLAGRKIALLENRKPGAEALLKAIGRELECRYGCEVEFHQKPDTTVVPDVIFKELSARFHGIVTGLGD